MKLESHRLKRDERRTRASALMLMVWAIMLMGVTVAGVVQYVSFSADAAILDAADFKTLHLAECGIVLGMHPDVRSTDPVLKQKVGNDSGFEVWLTSEGARLPINYITDSRVTDAVVKLFEKWGLSTEDATVAAQSLADWVDSDDDQRASGAEEDFYQGLGVYDVPRNQGFISVDEMQLARGMDLVERAQPEWREYFSVYSDGLIDLRHATKDVIVATTGADESDVENLISQRDGADGIHGTEDDGNLSDNSAFSLLGLSSAEMSAIRPNITYGGNTVRRVESIGWVGEKRRKITVIARRQDDNSLTYLARIEE
jgi:general secretion pathway protein K